jgi:Protein of unknown function (DUF1761)
MPAIHLNWLAIGASVLASVVIGFLWYGPILGNAWMKEMGVAPDFKPDPALLKRSMLLMILGASLTAVALACVIQLLLLSSWKSGNAALALAVSLGVWIGFYVPLLLSGVAWENRSWRLFGINAGYHLAALLAAAMILAHWR